MLDLSILMKNHCSRILPSCPKNCTELKLGLLQTAQSFNLNNYLPCGAVSSEFMNGKFPCTELVLKKVKLAVDDTAWQMDIQKALSVLIEKILYSALCHFLGRDVKVLEQWNAVGINIFEKVDFRRLVSNSLSLYASTAVTLHLHDPSSCYLIRKHMSFSQHSTFRVYWRSKRKVFSQSLFQMCFRVIPIWRSSMSGTFSIQLNCHLIFNGPDLRASDWFH